MGSISDYIGQHCDTGGYDANQRHNGDGTHETRTHSLERNRQQAGRTSRMEDGQHYESKFYSPGPDSGFKTTINRGRVGNERGGDQAMSVGTVHTSALTVNEYGAGPTPGIVTGNNRGVG